MCRVFAREKYVICGTEISNTSTEKHVLFKQIAHRVQKTTVDVIFWLEQRSVRRPPTWQSNNRQKNAVDWWKVPCCTHKHPHTAHNPWLFSDMAPNSKHSHLQSECLNCVIVKYGCRKKRTLNVPYLTYIWLNSVLSSANIDANVSLVEAATDCHFIASALASTIRTTIFKVNTSSKGNSLNTYSFIEIVVVVCCSQDFRSSQLSWDQG